METQTPRQILKAAKTMAENSPSVDTFKAVAKAMLDAGYKSCTFMVTGRQKVIQIVEELNAEKTGVAWGGTFLGQSCIVKPFTF